MTSPDPDAIPFVLKLGRALHVYGTPASQLEETLDEITKRLGYEGQFFALPTGFFAAIESPQRRRVEVARIEDAEVDLAKLSALVALADRVIGGETTATESSHDIDGILAAPPIYGAAATVLSYSFVSAAFSRFFGAGGHEIVLSLATGLAVGLLSLASTNSASLKRLFTPLAGLTVSLLAVLGASVFGPASVPIITVAGLIVLVPGVTLTLAVAELAERDLVSGASRLLGAMAVFLLLGFGVAVGAGIGSALIGTVDVARPASLAPWWTEAAAVLVSCVTLMVLLRVPRRELPWVVISCVTTYLTARQASTRFGPEVGVFLGALVAGSLSNIYSRYLGRIPAMTRIPAMWLLVPGGLGFTGIASLLEQDVLDGIRTGFSVAMIAVALVTGLIISDSIMPWRTRHAGAIR